MTKRIQNYVKFTPEELDQYVKISGSCVKKVKATLKLTIYPIGLRNFKKSLRNLLATERVGSYDQQLKGIILDISEIKLLRNTCPIRFDDPRIHVQIRGNCYVFQPVVGAIIRGKVRHVSFAQIGVVIYRVFNVSIRLVKKPEKPIKVDSEIYLKVKKFDVNSVVPYIVGELVEQSSIGEDMLDETQMEIDTLGESKDIIKLIEKIKTDEDQETID